MKPSLFIDYAVKVDAHQPTTTDWEEADREAIDQRPVDHLAGLRVPHWHRTPMQPDQRPPRVVEGAQYVRGNRATSAESSDDVGLITFRSAAPRTATIEANSDFRRVGQRPLLQFADIGNRRKQRERHTIKISRSCRPDRT